MSALFSTPDTPEADPQVGKAALENAKLSKEALDWYKQIYAENKPRQAALDETTKQVTEEQLATSQQQRAIAKDQWDRYQSTYVPVENQTVADALGYDSAARKDRLAGEAATGIQTQYDNAQAQQRRSMAAMGVNPNSGRAQALQSEGALALAASKAGAANNARIATEDKAIALRTGVANFGRNMPNTAGQSLASSVGSGSSAANTATISGNAARADAAMMGQGYNTAMQGMTNSGNLMNNQYSNQISAANGANAASSSSASGLGSLAGMGMMLAMSSKKVKTNKRKIDINQVIKGIRSVDFGARQEAR